MRVFVTGASGWIGSAVVPELISAGHQVTGLARSEASAAAIAAAGADVVRGTIEELDVLRDAAAAADGVVHLAFRHDFADFAAASAADRVAVETIGAALAGSDRPFVVTSGTAGLTPGHVLTEADRADPVAPPSPRMGTEAVVLGLAEKGVRSSVARMAPSVHGEGDHGFVAVIAEAARRHGVSGYPGDGTQRWSAVNRADAAVLYRLALEEAPAGTVWHGVGDEGVAVRDIARVIGEQLGVPVGPATDEEAAERLGFLAALLAIDMPGSSTYTQEKLGWKPVHPGLLEDLAAGYYTR